MAGWLGPDGSFEDVAGPGGHLAGAVRIGKRDDFEVPTSKGYEACYTACYERGYFRVTGVGEAFEIIGYDIQAHFFMMKKFMLRRHSELRDAWITLVDEKSHQHWRFKTWGEAMQGPK